MSLHHSDRITSEISIAWRYGRLSDHILPLLDVHQCAGYPVAMVLPYRAHQPLRDRMARMTLRQVQSYMRGLLIALSCMHKFNLIHRDGESAHRRQRGRANLVGRRSRLQRTHEHAPNHPVAMYFHAIFPLPPLLLSIVSLLTAQSNRITTCSILTLTGVWLLRKKPQLLPLPKASRRPRCHRSRLDSSSILA